MTKLHPQQRETLERLVRTIGEFCRRDQEPDREARARDNPEQSGGMQSKAGDPTPEERYATFGLFGSRGTGKSTLVRQLEKKLCEQVPSVHVCTPPLDCTALPQDVHFGVSLVDYLAAQFEEDQPVACRRSQGQRQGQISTIFREQLMPHFLPLDAQYRRLKLSLAVTSSEYQQIAEKELTVRQGIQGKVEEAIGGVLSHMRDRRDPKVRHLLVVLEDADLSVGRLNANLLSTFLTDFSSPQLLFLVVADEEHLEQRIANEGFRFRGNGGRYRGAPDRDPVKDSSRRTVLRMLDKLIPVNHRFYLSAWRSTSAWEFQPLVTDGFNHHQRDTQGGLAQTLGTGGVDGNRRSARNEGDTLGGLIQKTLKRLDGRREMEVEGLGLREQDLALLLPTNPRGLNDLYRQLASYCDMHKDERKKEPAEGSDRQDSQEGNRPARWSARDLLVVLAHCRGEHALARKLEARPVDWRAARLTWEEEALEGASWPRIHQEARHTGPIWALGSRERLLPGIDPGPDDALWAEILLNYSFRRSYSSLRFLFMERFRPLEDQIQQCGFTIRLTPADFNRLPDDFDILASPWFAFWDVESGIEVQTGWTNLLVGDLDRARRTFRTFLRDRFPQHLNRDQSSPDITDLAPRDIRSLFLLVDKMAKLPWMEIQELAEETAEWNKLVWVLDLLCARAYGDTFVDCLNLEEALKIDPRGEHSRKDDDGTVTRGPEIELELPDGGAKEHFGRSEDELRKAVESMSDSLRNGIPDEHAKHPMAIALNAFFDAVVRPAL